MTYQKFSQDCHGRFDHEADGFRYSCHLTRLAGADCLHVSLRSTIAQPEQRPPQFARHASSFLMRGHVLSICDPAMYLSPTIRISCFVGTTSHDPVLKIIEISERVARDLGLPPSRIVYWGSSAAGLGAVMSAINSADGRAVVFNPLLEVADFRRSGLAAPILGIFGAPSLDSVFETYPLRMSASSALAAARRGGRAPKLLIAQNARDTSFYRSQFVPFCKAFDLPVGGGSSNDGSLRTVLFTHPDGHSAEPPELVDQILTDGFPISVPVQPMALATPFFMTSAETRIWCQGVSGLGRMEDGRCWTVGSTAKMTFLLPEDCPERVSLDIAAHGFVLPQAPTVTADVLINGSLVGVLKDDLGAARRLKRARFDVPEASTGPRRPLTLELHVRDPRSPAHHGKSADDRDLGFGLVSLSVVSRDA